MAQITPVKVKIESKKRGPTTLKQERDDLIVLQPLLAHVMPNLTNRNAPTS
jgi:hypothetical protein